MKFINKQFIKNIYQIRKRKGISVAEIAQKMGISAAAYYKYENGLSFPNADNLNKLANVLGVELSELFK